MKHTRIIVYSLRRARRTSGARRRVPRAGWRRKIIWRDYGESDTMSNRVMLRPHCHSRVHRRELEGVNPRLFTQALREA